MFDQNNNLNASFSPIEKFEKELLRIQEASHKRLESLLAIYDRNLAEMLKSVK